MSSLERIKELRNCLVFFLMLPEHDLLYFLFLGSENNSLYLYYKGLSKTLLTFKFDTVKSVLDKDRKEDDTNEFVSAVCWRALPDGVSFLLTHTAGCWKDASWFHSKWHCWGFGYVWCFPVHEYCRPVWESEDCRMTEVLWAAERGCWGTGNCCGLMVSTHGSEYLYFCVWNPKSSTILLAFTCVCALAKALH